MSPERKAAQCKIRLDVIVILTTEPARPWKGLRAWCPTLAGADMQRHPPGCRLAALGQTPGLEGTHSKRLGHLWQGLGDKKAICHVGS